MGDQQEGVVEHPAPAAVVQRARHPHERKRETTGLPADPEQRPRVAPAFVRGSRHDLVTGGLKIRDSYAWVTAATC